MEIIKCFPKTIIKSTDPRPVYIFSDDGSIINCKTSYTVRVLGLHKT